MSTENSNKARYFNEIYQQYFTRCVLFAQSYAFDSQIAEDITSEAMITLWERLNSDSPVEQPIPFLFSVIRNKILHHLRHEQIKDQVHQKLESDESRELEFRISTLEACNPTHLYSHEVQTILQHSLSKMNEQTRRIFIMSRFEGKSNKEIAESLGISIKGVDYHMSKSLRQLRIDLKDYLGILLFFI